MKHTTLFALAGAALTLTACADDRSTMSSPAASSTPSVMSPAGTARATPSGIESTGSAGISGGAARPAAGTGAVGRTRTQ